MESRQVVGLTGALVLFIGVFTPIVSIPTVGYINYFQNEKIRRGGHSKPRLDILFTAAR